MNTRIDIFSEYIDNFGDLTIPIRLANELAFLYEEKVNLFISINDVSKEVLRINRLHKNINLYDLHQVN
ncbi:MAG: elongation factor P maturation arginine rhamnosyltransferase EarP, partial [Methylophilaceae bacterium]